MQLSFCAVKMTPSFFRLTQYLLFIVKLSGVEFLNAKPGAISIIIAAMEFEF
jgi:hypothetical protein